jgi:hypothetical protein
VLASQKQVQLSAILEFVPFVCPSTHYRGVHTDWGYGLFLDGKVCKLVLHNCDEITVRLKGP